MRRVNLKSRESLMLELSNNIIDEIDSSPSRKHTNWDII